MKLGMIFIGEMDKIDINELKVKIMDLYNAKDIKIYEIKRIQHKEMNRTLESDLRGCYESAKSENDKVIFASSEYQDLVHWCNADLLKL